MKSRINIFLSILLVVQLAIILIFSQPWSSKYARSSEEEDSLLFPEYDRDKTAAFEITAGEKKIRLEKREGKWIVVAEGKSFNGDIYHVDKLLNELGNVMRADIISDDPEKWVNYGVDDEGGYRLQVWSEDKKKVADAFLGKNVGSMKGTYLRMADTNGVMLVMCDLKSCVKKGDNWYFAWRDRTIHIDKREKEMVSIGIEGPHGRIYIERRKGDDGEPDSWFMTTPYQGEVKIDTINHMMSTLTYFKATGFAAPDKTIEELGLDKPKMVLTLGKRSGDNVVFTITEEQAHKKYRYVTVNTQPGSIFKMHHPYIYFFGADPAEMLKREEEMNGQNPIPGVPEETGDSK